MRRVVFDTSSLVGAVLRADSIPQRPWLLASSCAGSMGSPETYFEIETILRRDHLSRYVDTATRDRSLSNCRVSVEWVEISPSQLAAVDPSCREPKGNVFLVLAQLGGADTIVSSDTDLLVLHSWRGISVLSPSQFVSQLSI